MVQRDTTAQLEVMRELVDRIVSNREKATAPSDSNALETLRYFADGNYTEDTYALTLLFQELDHQLKTGATLPASWQIVEINGKLINRYSLDYLEVSTTWRS